MVTVDFQFRFMLCSHKDVLFNKICLNMLVLKAILINAVNGDNINKMSTCENLILYFSTKNRQLSAFGLPFRVSVAKQSLRKDVPHMTRNVQFVR